MDKSLKPEQENELSRFTQLLDKLLSVPHSAIKARLDAEKEHKKRMPKRRTSLDRACDEKV